jgi:hypothetical protein
VARADRRRGDHAVVVGDGDQAQIDGLAGSRGHRVHAAGGDRLRICAVRHDGGLRDEGDARDGRLQVGEGEGVAGAVGVQLIRTPGMSTGRPPPVIMPRSRSSARVTRKVVLRPGLLPATSGSVLGPPLPAANTVGWPALAAMVTAPLPLADALRSAADGPTVAAPGHSVPGGDRWSAACSCPERRDR